MALRRISYFQGRRDEAPNIELARNLAEDQDLEGIAEIVRNLSNSQERVRSDCIKVLYEIGSLNPELIAPHASRFLDLLSSRNNRLVWGGMSALAALAPLRAGLLCLHLEVILQAIEGGSVITRDQGMRVLAALAASGEACARRAHNALLQILSTCRPKDVPQYAESALRAVSPNNSGEFLALLERRLPQLSSAQSKRVRKIIEAVSRRGPAE